MQAPNNYHKNLPAQEQILLACLQQPEEENAHQNFLQTTVFEDSKRSKRIHIFSYFQRMRKEIPTLSPEDLAPVYGQNQVIPREIHWDFPQNSLQNVPPLGRDSLLLEFLSKDRGFCLFCQLVFPTFTAFFYPKAKNQRNWRGFSHKSCVLPSVSYPQGSP